MSKLGNTADGSAYVFSRWLIIISYRMRSTVHHWVRLIHNMLDSMHTFASARSISFYTLRGAAQLIQNNIQTKLKLTLKKEY